MTEAPTSFEELWSTTPTWTDEELKEAVTQSPLSFPLPEPDEKTQAAMRKVWRRHTLDRYVQRWDDAYVPDVPEELWSFDWRACDVGCGFGLFAFRESGRHPERAYLGIDKGTRRGSKLLQRIEVLQRPNLFGMHGNAIPILARMPAESFDLLTLYYPNPWWPTKHRKKRWSYHPIVPRLIELLKPNGELLLCSNEGFYLSEWLFTMQNHPAAEGTIEEVYVGPVTVDLPESRSHFESKFLQAGLPCGEIRFRKLG